MRRAIFLIHQYLGFTVGLYFIVICTSGAILIILENRIDDFRDYPVRHVPIGSVKQPLAIMLAAVERAHPSDRVEHILKSCDMGCTYDFSIRQHQDDRLDVLVDPYTGKIVQTTRWSTSPVGFLYDFHANLLGGDNGSMINSIIGLIAVCMVLAGLYLWPGWLRISRGFSMKLRADQWRINYDLHKITGIVCVTFFVFIVVTGTATVFLAEPRSAAGASTSALRQAALPLDTLVKIADRALPGQITMIYPPVGAAGALRIRKVVPGDPDPYGWSYVSVDQRSGKITAVTDSTVWPFWWRVYTYFYPLHIGSVGGLPLRFVYVVLACAPVVLYFTAFLMWLNKLKRDERAAAARPLDPRPLPLNTHSTSVPHP